MKKVMDLNRLLFYIQDVNESLGRLTNGTFASGDTHIVEATCQYLREYCDFKRLPQDFELITTRLKISVALTDFKQQVQTITIDKNEKIARRKYEQAALLRDREFRTLSQLVSQVSGCHLFYDPAQRGKIFWVIPELSSEMKIWFLDCLYSKVNAPR